MSVWSPSELTLDIRYGLRQLRRTPGFAAIAILTLALGIGANTAIFSVMNAVLLRYLPARDPQQLVFLHTDGQPKNTNQTGYDDASFQYGAYEQFRTQKSVFSEVVAFVPLSNNKIAVRYGDQPEEAEASEVSGNFFSGLGIGIARGHGFTPEDETNHTQIAVLNYGYWVRRFGANPSVMGQTVYIKSVPFSIVGVAAPGFNGLEREKSTDIWIPMQINPLIKPWGAAPQEKNTYYGAPDWLAIMMVGRLAPGVSQQQALAQLQPVYQQAAYAGKQPDKDEKPPRLYFTEAKGIEGMNQDYKKPLSILMVMVGLVLVIACGNVAMLLVARNSSRQREFSVRMALGGSRMRLFRQLLAESLLLVTAGGVLGWVFSIWATRALAAWSQMTVSLDPDRNVLLFTLALSVLAGIVFGLAPLRSVANVGVGLALKATGSSAQHDRQKVRSGQVVVALQMSLCLALLVGAGLLVRTLLNLNNADLGLRTKGLLVFGVTPPATLNNDSEVGQFYEDLLARFRSLPEVESATLMENRIGSGWSNNTGAFVDGAQPDPGKFSPMRGNEVGADFFHVLETPIVLGRDFTEADNASAPRVAIINQTFAERYLAKKNPIGHQIGLDNPKKPFTIVGVVQDSKYTSVREKPRPMAYFPYAQVGDISTMHIELRTRVEPVSVLPEVRRVLKEFNPDLTPMQPMSQQEQFNASFSQERLFARMAMFFGVLAVLLVATGLYGTLAYRVSRRTPEIGVRMALGAQRTQVLWMILRESLILCAIGIGVGLPLAVMGSRVLQSMLFGISPGDPLSFVIALLGVALVALLSGLLPARRASSVDPMVALRYE